MSQAARRKLMVISALLLAAAVVIPLLDRPHSDSRNLVVYCAHDSIFADDIIRQFEASSGIKVDVRYDEETNKSLGLTNLLIAEQRQPRCDVFWNNQTLGTIRLKKLGLLGAVDPQMLERIPAAFRDPDNHWCGFAARLRVYIVNTEKMKATEPDVQTALQASSLSNAAIAVSLFGTTYSHYAVLADQLGMDGLKSWHQSLRDRGIREVRGNGAVKDLVAEGACDLGFTDTDDAFAAIDAGKPVTMLPVRLENGKTICLPNSVAMIRNCAHPAEAEQFIRYLLSAEVEVALANSASRQIPLGPVDAQKLPPEVREQLPWAADGISLSGAAEQDEQVLKWLTEIYAGG